LWILSAPNADPDTAVDASLLKYGHLTRYDGNVWKTFKDSDGYPAAPLRTGVAFTPGGDVWVSTQKGLYRWNGANWSAYRTDLAFQSVAADPAGNISAGRTVSHSYGTFGSVMRFNGIGQQLSETDLGSDDASRLVFDASGALWTWGMWGSNAFYVRYLNYRYYGFLYRSHTAAGPLQHMAPEGYPCYFVQSMAPDESGGMWMSVRYINRNAYNDWKLNILRYGLRRFINIMEYGHRQGVFHWKDGQWTEYQTKNSGLQNEEISAMAQAPDGTLWFASASGLSSFKKP
jgi:hypothetical protein